MRTPPSSLLVTLGPSFRKNVRTRTVTGNLRAPCEHAQAGYARTFTIHPQNCLSLDNARLIMLVLGQSQEDKCSSMDRICLFLLSYGAFGCYNTLAHERLHMNVHTRASTPSQLILKHGAPSVSCRALGAPECRSLGRARCKRKGGPQRCCRPPCRHSRRQSRR